MSDVASLIIRVTTSGARAASSELGGLAKAAAGVAAALVSLETASQVFNTLVSTQRNFDKLNSSLITMTGSADNAAKAFGVLQQFAKETPYGLNQAVEGFTKLVALGLNPSKAALISYGNTAAAMGKDLNQMIEAVADAATGEFERLKEFGIKASQQGDKVSFTFQGVTTTVRKNSEEIQKYLLNIGDTNFAGAMEERSKTLDGALSSLSDTTEGLFLSIAQSGFGDAVAEQVRNAEDAVQSLTDTIASGELRGEIIDWVKLINDSFAFISDTLNDLAFETENKSNDMTSSLSSIPDEIRNWLPEIQETFMNVIAWFQRIDDYAVAFGQSLADALDPSKTASITYKNLTKAAEDNYNATVKLNKAEADGIRDRSKARQKEIDDNRKAYEEKRKQEVDLRTLVKDKPGSTSDNGSSAADKKKADAAAKLAERQKEQAQAFMDGIARQNEDELKAIDAQEQQKLAKLMEFQELGAVNAQQYEDTKTAIQLNAETARQEELDKRKKKRDEEAQKGDDFLAQIMGQNATELELYDIQQKQKEDIAKEYRDKGRIDETEYQASLVAIAGNYNKKRVTEYSSMLGTTTDNLRTALGEGNKMYKAFAIANAIMNTYQGAVAAFQSAASIPIVGWVAAPIAAAAAVAAGLANVAKIRSAREQGGNLAAGQMSTLVERGRAEVIMPAGASRVRTAQQMRQIMGEDRKSSGMDGGVTIVNQTSSNIGSATTERDDEGRLRVIIRETVSGDMADSNSSISKTRRATRGGAGYQ